MSDKALVALEAAKLAENNMLVGLGTGSTANLFIQALSDRVRQEGLVISVVASSTISAIKAQSCGLNLQSFDANPHVDLYVDGADEITPQYTLLKGRGQDLVMEKLLATGAEQFVVVADQSKRVSYLGEKFVIPVEVLPIAWRMVINQLSQLGARAVLRLNAAGDNVFVAASGQYVLDVSFPRHFTEENIQFALNTMPGVVEHGVFSRLATKVLIADQGQLQVIDV